MREKRGGAVTTEEALWEIIAGEQHGILATIGADGSPHMSNVFYVCDLSSRLIRVSTTTVRVKGRNLQRDPRAALHVSGQDFFNFAVAEGTVSLAMIQKPDDPSVDELSELRAALGMVSDLDRSGEQMVADHRMVVRLAVRTVYGLTSRQASGN
jgi:PPOX class probable F420-dependent enzyme